MDLAYLQLPWNFPSQYIMLKTLSRLNVAPSVTRHLSSLGAFCSRTKQKNKSSSPTTNLVWRLKFFILPTLGRILAQLLIRPEQNIQTQTLSPSKSEFRTKCPLVAITVGLQRYANTITEGTGVFSIFWYLLLLSLS